jgi:hypothetical protein
MTPFNSFMRSIGSITAVILLVCSIGRGQEVPDNFQRLWDKKQPTAYFRADLKLKKERTTDWSLERLIPVRVHPVARYPFRSKSAAVPESRCISRFSRPPIAWTKL